MKRLATIVSFCTLQLATGCGGGEPPPETADTANERRSERRSSLPSVDSEIGALDPDKVDRTFESTLPDLQKCLHAGAQRVEFLGGSVHFFLKIDMSGSIEHAHLEASSLGDRQTEKCMLDSVRRKSWPKPEGGRTGLARKSFEFDPPNDVRPPAALSYGDIQQGLNEGDVAAAVAQCKSGASGSFTITMYVGTEGEVLAAGGTPPDERGEQSVDCLVTALKDATFPSPGSWPGKVQFTF